MNINDSIVNLKPYKLTEHSAWDDFKNKEILKLDWNESTVPPSPLVRKYLTEYLELDRLNWYPDINNRSLLQKISDYTKMPEENIDYFASSDCIHEYLARIFLEVDDDVLILGPTYDNFRAVAEGFGSKIFIVNADEKNNFEIPLQKLKNKIKEINPTITYICNPNNPTGKIIDKKEIVKLAEKYPNTAFVVDEAYFEFSRISIASDVLKYKNIIVTRTFSKAFGLASARIGYLIANKFIINLLKKIKNHKSISSFAQISAFGALSDLDYMKANVENVIQGKILFCEWAKLKKFNVISGYGNFLLIDFGDLKDSIIDYLKSHKIYIRKYDHVKGMGTFTRITIGSSELMIRVCNKIDQFLK